MEQVSSSPNTTRNCEGNTKSSMERDLELECSKRQNKCWYSSEQSLKCMTSKVFQNESMKSTTKLSFSNQNSKSKSRETLSTNDHAEYEKNQLSLSKCTRKTKIVNNVQCSVNGVRHKKINQYNCHSCSESFRHDWELTKHLMQTLHKCEREINSKRLNDKASLKLNVFGYNCHMCLEICNTEKILRKHLVDSHDGGKFRTSAVKILCKCDSCSKQLTDKSNSRIHLRNTRRSDWLSHHELSIRPSYNECSQSFLESVLPQNLPNQEQDHRTDVQEHASRTDNVSSKQTVIIFCKKDRRLVSQSVNDNETFRKYDSENQKSEIISQHLNKTEDQVNHNSEESNLKGFLQIGAVVKTEQSMSDHDSKDYITESITTTFVKSDSVEDESSNQMGKCSEYFLFNCESVVQMSEEGNECVNRTEHLLKCNFSTKESNSEQNCDYSSESDIKLLKSTENDSQKLNPANKSTGSWNTTDHIAYDENQQPVSSRFKKGNEQFSGTSTGLHFHYNCHSCLKTFRHDWELKKHLMDTVQKCLPRINRKNLNISASLNRNVFGYNCHICLETCEDQKKLRKHLIDKHDESPAKMILYKCNSCLKLYTDKSSCRRHLRTTKHIDGLSHHCRVCLKDFVKASQFSQHVYYECKKTLKDDVRFQSSRNLYNQEQESDVQEPASEIDFLSSRHGPEAFSKKNIQSLNGTEHVAEDVSEAQEIKLETQYLNSTEDPVNVIFEEKNSEGFVEVRTKESTNGTERVTEGVPESQEIKLETRYLNSTEDTVKIIFEEKNSEGFLEVRTNEVTKLCFVKSEAVEDESLDEVEKSSKELSLDCDSAMKNSAKHFEKQEYDHHSGIAAEFSSTDFLLDHDSKVQISAETWSIANDSEYENNTVNGGKHKRIYQYNCHSCSETFRHDWELTKHLMQTVHKCQLDINSKSLTDNVTLKLNVFGYNCHMCLEIFEDEGELRTHLVDSHDGSKYGSIAKDIQNKYNLRSKRLKRNKYKNHLYNTRYNDGCV